MVIVRIIMKIVKKNYQKTFRSGKIVDKITKYIYLFFTKLN